MSINYNSIDFKIGYLIGRLDRIRNEYDILEDFVYDINSNLNGLKLTIGLLEKCVDMWCSDNQTKCDVIIVGDIQDPYGYVYLENGKAKHSYKKPKQLRKRKVEIEFIIEN